MEPESRGADTRETIEAVARRSYGKLLAFLAARTRDVAAAEDALSEAFAAALADWPANGCPANPEAWLLTAARRKTIDRARHRQRGELVAAQIKILAEGLGSLSNAGGDSRSATCASLRLRASGHRGSDPRSLDAADRARP